MNIYKKKIINNEVSVKLNIATWLLFLSHFCLAVQQGIHVT
jgi:uncharacterized membrane protein YpjA